MKNLTCVLLSVIMCHSALVAMDTSDIIKKDHIFIQKKFKEYTPDHKIATITQLHGWGGSRLYDVSFDKGDSYVVRLLVGQFSKKPKWQQAEIDAMQAAASAGVGPGILAAHARDKEHPEGYIIMDKIAALPTKEVPWKEKETYNRLGNFLYKMHTQSSVIPTNAESLYIRMNKWAERYQDTWTKNKVLGLSEEFKQIESFIERTRPMYTSKERTKLVHGDLLWGNLLYDGNKFIAVDWEQSMLAPEPLFDLALVYDCLVPKKYRKEFMNSYCQQDRLPAHDLDRFRVVRCIAACFIGLAYGFGDINLFADKVHQYVKKETNINDVMHELMVNGFKKEARADAITFGALLFAQGCKKINGKTDEILKRILINQPKDDQRIV